MDFDAVPIQASDPKNEMEGSAIFKQIIARALPAL